MKKEEKNHEQLLKKRLDILDQLCAIKWNKDNNDENERILLKTVQLATKEVKIG